MCADNEIKAGCLIWTLLWSTETDNNKKIKKKFGLKFLLNNKHNSVLKLFRQKDASWVHMHLL